MVRHILRPLSGHVPIIWSVAFRNRSKPLQRSLELTVWSSQSSALCVTLMAHRPRENNIWYISAASYHCFDTAGALSHPQQSGTHDADQLLGMIPHQYLLASRIHTPHIHSRWACSGALGPYELDRHLPNQRQSLCTITIACRRESIPR